MIGGILADREIVMLNSIVVGLLLSIVTIGVHGLGTIVWISYLQKMANNADPARKRRLLWQLRILSFSAGILLLMHIVEVTIWAVVYLLLVHQQPLGNIEEAIYFSTVTFTSLGYGDVVLEEPWRLLSAIQAMTGILVFGWSTALLFAVVQRIWIADDRRVDPR